jgi:hypothetical protein
VSGLEEVAATSDKLIATEPARAVALYESFLAGCHAKADELDDSSGSFGQFAQDLICRWIKARQATGADPDKTTFTLLTWMDDDPYAFCYQIEKMPRQLSTRQDWRPSRGRFENTSRRFHCEVWLRWIGGAVELLRSRRS